MHIMGYLLLKIWVSEDYDTIRRKMLIFIFSCSVPDLLAIDLRVKLAVCLIHLKFVKLVKVCLSFLFM